MTNRFQALQGAIVAALMAAPALADGRITANRLRPVTAGIASALVVRRGPSDGTEEVLGRIDWSTPFTVECYARGADTDSADQRANTLLDAAWARLSTLDLSSHDAALRIDPKVIPYFDELEDQVVCITLAVTVTHRTSVTNLE